MATKKGEQAKAATGQRLGEKHGRRNLWNEDPDDLTIEEEDPRHPDHEEHMWRVSDANPEWVEFKASAQADGWWDENVVHVFQRVKGGPKIVANGKRSTTLARLLNKGRKPGARVLLACLPTSDPERTKAVANSNRARERPITIARWYVAAKAVDGPRKAAARLGITMAQGAAYEKILHLPAEVQARVNAYEIPIDVAVRDIAALPASEAVAVVESAKDDAGKVQKGRVRAAAREAREKHAPPRMKARPRAQVEEAVRQIEKWTALASVPRADLLALLWWSLGNSDHVHDTGVSPELQAIIEDAQKAGRKAKEA